MKNKTFSAVLLLASAILFTNCSGNGETNSETPATNTETTEIETQDTLAQTLENGDIIEVTEFEFNEEGFSQKAELTVYLSDPDMENPTNLRSGPGGKIIEKLIKEDDYMFTIVEQKDGWFKVNDFTSFNETYIVQSKEGWLHHSVIGAATRYCDNNGTNLYKYPDANDEFYLETIEADRAIRILRYYYDYAEISYEDDKGEIKKGWIRQECICGNPVTTCP